MTDITVSSLVKSYELGKNILNGLSFTVESGERLVPLPGFSLN